MASPRRPDRNPALAFNLGDIGFAIKLIGHLARASAPDITWGTFQRFIAAPNGMKERGASIAGYIGSDPMVLQRLVHSIEGDYKVLKDGEAYVVRDFDLWFKCCSVLGHRGDYVPELFDRSFKGGAFAAQPSRYGACPFGNHDVYFKEEPHNASRDRLPEHEDMMRSIVRDRLDAFVGKKVEIGVLLRKLVWDVYTASSLGVMPSDETEDIRQTFDEHMKEFEYALRMAGLKLTYEWSPELHAQIDKIDAWAKGVLEDRIKNIDKYSHQSDFLTDTIINHPDSPTVKSVGAIRGAYPGGYNNFHCALTGALLYNALHDDEVQKYYAENPKENIEHIMREAFRLYMSVANFRNVREEDDLEIDGVKLKPGTDVLLSTYGIATDPRTWENPMDFNPKRFENTEQISFMCQKGFAPFGAPVNPLGGRPCAGQFQNAVMMRVMLDTILSEYKISARRGFFDFKSNSGTSVYCGDCHVTVEKR